MISCDQVCGADPTHVRQLVFRSYISIEKHFQELGYEMIVWDSFNMKVVLYDYMMLCSYDLNKPGYVFLEQI